MPPIEKLGREDFPPLLSEIPDPPKQLYVRGKLPSAEYAYLTVVGSRAMSPYGKQACDFLIRGLRGYKVAIVSGLAYGVDAQAHKAALEATLPTIAVPGSGLDESVLYPRAHLNLARGIVQSGLHGQGGALLSEFEPTMKASDYTFPQRNRIMAGLSKAILLIEAKERSGTLITARLAAEYNRELLVVPGSIFSEGSRGTHQFLKLGATPVTSPEDILNVLGIAAQNRQEEVPADVSDDERKVLEIIETPCAREHLVGALELSVSEANVLISTMEIKGLIVEELGIIRRA